MSCGSNEGHLMVLPSSIFFQHNILGTKIKQTTLVNDIDLLSVWAARVVCGFQSFPSIAMGGSW